MIPRLIIYVLLLCFFLPEPTVSQDTLWVGTEGTVLDLDLSQIGMNGVRHKYPWLDGSGIRVSIQEEAFDSLDADLVGRYLDVGLTSERSTEHATAMATVIGGAGNTSVRGLGVAPGVLLSPSNLSGLLPDPVEVYRQNELFLQNHSYGGDRDMPYNHQARAFDQSMYEEPRLLHIFSSGNDGTAQGLTRLGRIPAGANLTGPFKQAKNVLLVGAIDTIQEVLGFSSRGPTYDGRIKPDLVTYALFGSSNAAALTTGVCALLQQAHIANYGSYPSAALLKAILIQSAAKTGDPGPDHRSGFGALDAYAAVETLMEDRFIQDSLTGKNKFLWEWTVQKPGDQMRIALAWIDPPAVDTTARLLVNDLDLRLVTPDGDTIMPWTIPFAARSDLKARRGHDTLNTVEVITYQNPSAGRYQLVVSGNMAEGVTQNFSLAYGMKAKDRFKWTYPLASDPVPFTGESFTYVQWDTDQVSTGVLEAQLPGSSGWTILTDSLSLAEGRWRWKIPTTLHGLARLRIRTESAVHLSDTFRISHPLRPRIALVCGDSMLLEWSAVPGTTGYRLWVQDGSYLRPATETQDTLFFWRKPDLPQSRIAVEPLFEERSTALTSESLPLDRAAEICYINSFFANGLADDRGVVLNGNLSTRWQVSAIRWQRLDPDGIYRDMVRQIPDSDSIRFLDTEPSHGQNVYRLAVETFAGKEYVSNPAEAWYIREPRVVFFPNPAPRNGWLTVFTGVISQEENGEIRAYDSMGRLVHRQSISTERFVIPLQNWAPGYYVVEVRGLGEVIRHRVVVQ
jgi:hypothetical protein